MVYSDTERVIPAAAPAPASRYSLSVEQATLEDTARGAGVPVVNPCRYHSPGDSHAPPASPDHGLGPLSRD